MGNFNTSFINASKDYVNYSDNENLYKIPTSGGKRYQSVEYI